MPVHWIVRVLQKVRAGFTDQLIGVYVFAVFSHLACFLRISSAAGSKEAKSQDCKHLCASEKHTDPLGKRTGNTTRRYKDFSVTVSMQRGPNLRSKPFGVLIVSQLLKSGYPSTMTLLGTPSDINRSFQAIHPK